MKQEFTSSKFSKLRSFLLAIFLFWLPVVLFLYIASEVIGRKPVAFDDPLLHWIHAHSSHFYDKFFLAVTTLGNVEIIAPLALLIAAVMWRKKYRAAAFIVFFGFFGAGAINFILKDLFHRQRPAFWHAAITETGYSFPSGHAMLSSALALSIALAAWHTRWRWPAVIVGAVSVLLIGYSRLYLGVHFPTDVIAGWCASAAWVAIVAKVVALRRHKIARAQ